MYIGMKNYKNYNNIKIKRKLSSAKMVKYLYKDYHNCNKMANMLRENARIFEHQSNNKENINDNTILYRLIEADKIASELEKILESSIIPRLLAEYISMIYHESSNGIEHTSYIKASDLLVSIEKLENIIITMELVKEKFIEYDDELKNSFDLS